MEAIFVAFLVAFSFGIFASWYWSGGAKIRRALRNAPRVAIADAPEGMVVRLDGRVVEGETLRAPLTGRRCVYYLAIIDEQVPAGKSTNWHVRVREARGVRFVMEDGTGRALVDPSNALVDVDLDSTARSGTFDDPTEVEQAFLDRHRVKGAGWVFNKALRYREGVFEVGEPIAVLCQPVREPDPEAVSEPSGYRDGPPTRLRISGSPKYPVLLSDSRDITQRE